MHPAIEAAVELQEFHAPEAKDRRSCEDDFLRKQWLYLSSSTFTAIWP